MSQYTNIRVQADRPYFAELMDGTMSFEEIAVGIEQGEINSADDVVFYTLYNGYGNEYNVALEDGCIVQREDGNIKCVDELITIRNGEAVFSYCYANPAILVKFGYAEIWAEPKSWNAQKEFRSSVKFGKKTVYLQTGDIVYKRHNYKITPPKK